MVSKTVYTKMLQTVRNNGIAFGKVVAYEQLSHLVINKINHVAMIITSKNPNSSHQIKFWIMYIYIFLKNLKQLKIITNINFQRKATEFVTYS